MARHAAVVALTVLLVGVAQAEKSAPPLPAASPALPTPVPTPPKNGRPVPKNVTVEVSEKPTTMLSSSSKGIGASCVPSSDNYYGPGSGCSETEACCPTTNTCLDRSGGCAAFAARCAPADCGKDMNFKDADCPADVTKLYKKGGVKCQSSADTVCFANQTSMALRCAVSAGAAPGPQLLVALMAGLLAVLFAAASNL